MVTLDDLQERVTVKEAELLSYVHGPVSKGLVAQARVDAFTEVLFQVLAEGHTDLRRLHRARRMYYGRMDDIRRQSPATKIRWAQVFMNAIAAVGSSGSTQKEEDE